MPTFHPIDDQILVLREPADRITASGLHLPERDVTRPLRGTVLAVGPGRLRNGARTPVSVAVGAVVVHARYAGTEVRFDDADCLVLREADVLGVIEADADQVPA